MTQASESSVEEALELCDEILEMTEELADNERAEEFAASVTEKVTSMKKWIEDNKRVTDKMTTSLGNMKAGCEKWLSWD